MDIHWNLKVLIHSLLNYAHFNIHTYRCVNLLETEFMLEICKKEKSRYDLVLKGQPWF